MNVSISDLRKKVRYLIGDNLKTVTDYFKYTNSSIFTLTEENIEEVFNVYQNDSELESGEWSYEDGKVYITKSLSTEDNIYIKLTCYPNYSATEIENYIKAALVNISANGYKTWICEDDYIEPSPDENEENLICMIASFLIDKPISSYRLPDITLNFPENISLSDKINKTISIFRRNKTGVFFIG